MRIVIAGATGVIGRPLVRRLVAAGHSVAGLTRTQEGAERISADGATPVVADVYDPGRLLAAVGGHDPEVVIHQLTALPRRLDVRNMARDLAPTNRLRTEGTDRLIDAARAAGATRFIAQSIAFAYAPGGPEPRTEDDPLMSNPPTGFECAVAAIRHLESAVLHADGLAGVVLRFGHCYGPGTAYAADGAIADDVRGRKFPMVGDGQGRLSFVHVEDAAQACVAALDGPPGIYNIVDDRAAQAGEWLPYYAQLLEAPRPMRVPAFLARLLAGPYPVHLMTRMPGASNSKARSTLGWDPKYPDWRGGFRAELGT